jgi:hypothetical protein
MLVGLIPCPPVRNREEVPRFHLTTTSATDLGDRAARRGSSVIAGFRHDTYWLYGERKSGAQTESIPCPMEISSEP